MEQDTFAIPLLATLNVRKAIFSNKGQGHNVINLGVFEKATLVK